MSLIIKGMEMPQAGDVIICGQIEGKLQCTIVTRGKPTKWCEASEVSTPHGRLIDADKAATSISMMNNHPCGNSIETVNDVVEWLRFVDENGNNVAFPTIIEAEVN